MLYSIYNQAAALNRSRFIALCQRQIVLQRLQCAENSVARIPKAGQNIAFIVQPVI